MYPKLEEVLEQPIHATLTDDQANYFDEGLTCMAELIYNQDQVSQRIWNFFEMITLSLMRDPGTYSDYIESAFAVFINLINKAPEQFKTVSFNHQGQQMTALDMTCLLIQESLKVAKEKEDELDGISVVTLSFALLENIQGIQSTIPGLMDIYLKELQEASTPEYTTMLLQGILMCLWYDLDTTMTILEQTGTTDNFL